LLLETREELASFLHLPLIYDQNLDGGSGDIHLQATSGENTCASERLSQSLFTKISIARAPWEGSGPDGGGFQD